MAQKPDGKSGRTERVSFTRPAAERIAKVVRTVEAGNRKSAPLYFGSRQSGGTSPVVFRIATFTGQWDVNAVTGVTFVHQTNTPNTAEALNLFAALGTSANDPRPCAIAREGTGWYLIAALCEAE